MTRPRRRHSLRTSTLAAPLGCCLAASLAACGAPPGDEVGSRSSQIEVLDECDDWGCGKNSPRPGGLAFHEVHPHGLPNEAGLTVGDFRAADGTLLDLQAAGHRLLGVPPVGAALEGDALVGATLQLLQDGKEFAVLNVHQAGVTTFWAGDANPVPVYTFVYQLPSGKKDNLCPGIGISSTESLKFGGAHTAILFSGDRYDAATKTITATGAAAGEWINIACAGSALAKMHLLRHTGAGSDATHGTDSAQRQAMFKMITADYCGTGRAFTANGQPLGFLDNRGWFVTDMTTMASIESIWTEDGAVCLDVARRADEEPGIAAQIAAECGAALPPCAPLLAKWKSRGYLLSANPQ